MADPTNPKRPPMRVIVGGLGELPPELQAQLFDAKTLDEINAAAAVLRRHLTSAVLKDYHPEFIYALNSGMSWANSHNGYVREFPEDYMPKREVQGG